MEKPAKIILGRKRQARGQAKYTFQLYVAGTTRKSTQAITGIKNLLEQHLKGRYALEVIDIYQNLPLVKRNRITVVPALVRKRPLPVCKIVGRLCSAESVLGRLKLKSGLR